MVEYLYKGVFMKKEALLIIDIQDIYFTKGDLLLFKPELAAKNASVVLEKFRKEGKTVIHVQHNFGENAGINKIVEPLPTEKIIKKDFPSSFLKTDLQQYLQEQKIEKLVVVGMMSHMCVDTTVRACQDYGYEVTVIQDACTTLNLTYGNITLDATTVHNSFMAALNGMFAKVVSLNEYINE